MRGRFGPTVAIAVIGAVIAAAGPAAGATVVVKPGRLDHFVITAPPTALAGETFLVRIDPYDASGNLITEFPGKGPSFTVGVSSGEVSPAKLRAAELAGGATVKVADKRAGVLDLTVTEGDGATPLATGQVRVLPNRLDHFVVTTPREAVAGTPFQARVIAVDAFGNTKTDLADVSLRVEVMGTGAAEAAEKAVPPFRGGEAILSFEPRLAGSVKVAVLDTHSRAGGEGDAVKIGPGPLRRFALFAPKAAVAGQPFIVLVAAYDAFGNRVTSYQTSGDGVSFSPSGSGALSPASVAAAEFTDGQARVKFTYTKAESLRITAREQGREPAGESDAVLVGPGDPDHFRVTTPAEAIAGEGFAAEFEALDRYGNRIEDYDLRGIEVLLSADGTGTLRPAAISPSAFVRGVAKVTLSYDRAESFTVVAALSKEALEKLIAERRRQAASPPEPAVSPEEEARGREREEAARAREEAHRAREEGEKRRAREEAEKARAAAQRAREEAAKRPPKAAAPSPAAAPPVARPSSGPSAAPAATQPSLPVLKIVEGVTVEEGAGQTLVRVATSGPVSYNATTGSELAKEWIWLELFPVRIAAGVPGSVPVSGGLVGQVLVGQSDPEKVKVSLQVLPPGISYVVTQQDRAVVVKVVKAP